MQVLKLVYYCHAWMLGLYGRPLIRQPIEAWRYGPVVPECVPQPPSIWWRSHPAAH